MRKYLPFLCQHSHPFNQYGDYSLIKVCSRAEWHDFNSWWTRLHSSPLYVQVLLEDTKLFKYTKCSSSTWTLLGNWCCCCCCCCSPFSSLPPSSEVLVSIFSVAMATDHTQFGCRITWLVMGVVGWLLTNGRGFTAQIQRRACPTSTAKEREREEMVIFVFHCFPYSLWFAVRLVKEMHHLKHHHPNQK